ncbi:MAG: hypothetical protein U9N43_04775, partial [Euryarchaeota archaeon]|nr:hypothetical protein [Euryarchaeota archaeon]
GDILFLGTVWEFRDFRNGQLDIQQRKNAKTRWRKEQKFPGIFHWDLRLRHFFVNEAGAESDWT